MHKKPIPLFFKHYKTLEELNTLENENYKNLTDEIILKKIEEIKTKGDYLKILQLMDFHMSDELIKYYYLKLKEDASDHAVYALQIKIYLLKLKEIKISRLLQLTEDPIELAAYFSKWSSKLRDFQCPNEKFNTFLFLNNLNEKALLHSNNFIRSINEEGLLRFYRNSLSVDFPLNEFLLDCLLKNIEIPLPIEVFDYFKTQNRFLMALHQRICLKFNDNFFIILFSGKYNHHSAYHDLLKQVVNEYLRGKPIKKLYVEELLNSLKATTGFLKQEIVLKLSSSRNISDLMENITYDKYVKEFLNERNKRFFGSSKYTGEFNNENVFSTKDYAEIYNNTLDGFSVTENQLSEFLISLLHISWRKILELEFIVWRFSSTLLEHKDFLLELGRRFFQYGFILKTAFSFTNEDLLNHKYQGSFDFDKLCNKQYENRINNTINTLKDHEEKKRSKLTEYGESFKNNRDQEIAREAKGINHNILFLLNTYKKTGNQIYLKEINSENLNYNLLLIDLKVIFKEDFDQIKEVLEHLGNFHHVFSLKFLIFNNLLSPSLIIPLKADQLLIQMAELKYEEHKKHKEIFKEALRDIDLNCIYEKLFINWEDFVLEMFLERVLKYLIMNSPQMEYKNKCDLCENIISPDLCETLKQFSNKTIYFYKSLMNFYEKGDSPLLFCGLSKNALKNILRRAPKNIKYIFTDYSLTELISVIKTEEFINLRVLLYNKLEILCKEKEFNFKIKSELHDFRKDMEIFKYPNWTHYTFLEFQITNDLITETYEKSTLKRCFLKNQFCLSLWETNNETFLDENIFRSSASKYFLIQILKQELHKVSLQSVINIFFNLKNPLEVYCSKKKYIQMEFKSVFLLFIKSKKYNEKKVIEKCMSVYSIEQIKAIRELFR